MGVHRKIRFLGGVHEKTKIYREDCLKTGDFGQFADLRGGFSKKRGCCF